jgi:hypothetical protein
LVTLHCLWCLTQLLSTALLHTIFELHSQRTVGAIACIHLVGRLEWTKFLSKSTFTTQILLEFRKITIFKSSCLSHTCLTIVTLAWTMTIAKVCLRGGSRQSTSVPRGCDGPNWYLGMLSSKVSALWFLVFNTHVSYLQLWRKQEDSQNVHLQGLKTACR